MSLLKKSQENIKDLTANTEEVDCIITAISSISDERKVKLTTDKGVFFPWKQQFPNGKVPYVGKGLKATVTLVERTVDESTFINVLSINYNVDELSTKQLVATMGNSVSL